MSGIVILSTLAVILAVAPPSSCHGSIFEHGWLALPAKAAPTVNVVFTITEDRVHETCRVSAFSGQNMEQLLADVTVAKDTHFMVPEVSKCVVFKCETKGAEFVFGIDESTSGCQYSSTCVDDSVVENGQRFTCVKDLKFVVVLDGVLTYKLRIGLSATPAYIEAAVKQPGYMPSSVDSHINNETGTCTIEGKTVRFGEQVEIVFLNDRHCVTLICTESGIVADDISCIGPGDICADLTSDGCAHFQCLVTTEAIRRGPYSFLTTYMASWLPISRGCPTNIGNAKCRQPGEQWAAEEKPGRAAVVCTCDAETLRVSCVLSPPITARPPFSTTTPKLLTTLKSSTAIQTTKTTTEKPPGATTRGTTTRKPSTLVYTGFTTGTTVFYDTSTNPTAHRHNKLP